VDDEVVDEAETEEGDDADEADEAETEEGDDADEADEAETEEGDEADEAETEEGDEADEEEEEEPVPKRRGRPKLTEEEKKSKFMTGHFQSYKGKFKQSYKV